MANISGGINFNLEHEGNEVKSVISLIKKLPRALEEYNSNISIRDNHRISKDQFAVVEDWVTRTKSFEDYIKGIT